MRPSANGQWVENVTINNLLVDGSQPGGVVGAHSAENGFTADQVVLQGVHGGTLTNISSRNGGENGLDVNSGSRNVTEFDDAAFPCTWHIDVHSPNPDYFKKHDPDAFFSTFTRGKKHEYEGPYWAPYRCLYSRNIDNLFMAGRDISVTQNGLDPVRVMRTCGMMGEIVAMAASICKSHDCSPRGVYQSHLAELKDLMSKGAGKNVSTASDHDAK